MKNKANIFLLLTILLTAFGCSKTQLDLTNPNNVEATNFWKNETDALQGVLGIYDAFQNNNLAGDSYSKLDLLTDNMATNQNLNGWFDVKNFNNSSLTAVTNNFWRSLYTVVSRSNLVIDKVASMPSSAISDAKRSRILAEAYFLRNYAYYDLIMMFQGVPFYNKPNEVLSEGLPATKGSIIADSLINCLVNVIPNLPLADTDGKGRVTRGAAVALLGKLYLTNGSWAQAVQTLAQLKQSPYSYALFPSYAGLFTPDNEFNNSEVLFQINFINSQIDNGEIFSFKIDTTTSPSVTPFVVPRNAYQVLANFRDSWLYTDGRPRVTSSIYGTASPLISTQSQAINRDLRYRTTIFSNIDTTASRKPFWSFAIPATFPNSALATTSNANATAVKKYFFITPVVYTNGNPQNYYLMRYSDVLLMLAEAELEINPSDPDIYTNIQLVRNRAGVAMFTTTAWNALSVDSKRTVIRDERRWEFGFEHVRFFDLRRWGVAYTKRVLLATNPLIPATTPDIAFVQWPYPQAELDNNPALKAQGGNPGW